MTKCGEVRPNAVFTNVEPETQVLGEKSGCISGITVLKIRVCRSHYGMKVVQIA